MATEIREITSGNQTLRLDPVNGLSTQRVFDCLAGSRTDALSAVLSKFGIIPGVSIFQDSQGEIPDLYCTAQIPDVVQRGPVAPGSTNLFEVTVSYARNPRGGRVQAVPNGPTVWWNDPSMQSATEDIDIFGNACQNTVDEPFDQGYTALRFRETLVAEFYRASPNRLAMASSMRPYVGRTNATAYQGYPANCLLMYPPAIEQKQVKLFKNTVRFEYREPIEALAGVTYYSMIGGVWTNVTGKAPFPGWADLRPNTGTRKIVNSGSSDPKVKYGPIPGPNGNVTSPVLIDKDGSWVLASGMVVIVAQLYKTAEFSGLKL